jgi:hypothetical protein
VQVSFILCGPRSVCKPGVFLLIPGSLPNKATFIPCIELAGRIGAA